MHFHPELLHAGHSMAATYLGEIYSGFGRISIAVGFLLIPFAIAYLDLKMVLTRRITIISNHLVAKLVVLSILSAGLFDYVWVGSFTFFSRNLTFWVGTAHGLYGVGS